MNDAWYEVTNVAELDSPALLVHPARVQENVRRMIAYAGGVERLRPHVKSHKMPAMIRLQMAAGIGKFKVATIAEAEMVARAGAPDVLLAYQPVGPNAGRFARLVAAIPGTRFSTIADDAGAVEVLSRELAAAGQTAEVLLDIDVGMHRTGIAPGPAAVELYRQICRSPGLKPGGLHVYDGHVRERDLDERREHCLRDFAPAEQLRKDLTAAGMKVPRVVAGGTPTFPIHARYADRECSPGTCTLWDASYEAKFPDLEFLHAAVVLTRVISKPSQGRLCLDLGYKAIASDNPDPRVVLLGLPDARMVNHSEEHLAVETSHAGEFSVGDPVYGIPFHVCPTSALHREVIVIENRTATGRWTVEARDRRLSI